jgi:hypothetical protein
MELGAGGPLFVAGQLSVQTGGGDFLNLQHALIVGDLRIDSGFTNLPEFIRLKSVSARGIVVLTGAGDDIVNVAFSTAEKQLAVFLGEGDDVLSMYVVAYNNPETRDDDLLVAAYFFGHDGRDTLAFDGCRFEGVASFEGGNGDDHLLLTRSLVNHLATIWMDRGRDRVEVAFSAISLLFASMGADDDQVFVRTSAIDQARVSLNEGSDLLDIDGCVLRALGDADGGAGFDTLNRRNSRIRQFNAENFEAGKDAGLLFN